MNLHHFGFATNSIENSLLNFEKLGYKKITECIVDPIQKVRIQFLQKDHTPLLELIEPMSVDSPVSKILKTNSATLYHSCYEVDNITETLQELRDKGFVLIMKPTPAVALENRLVCFLFNAHTGLIELLSK